MANEKANPNGKAKTSPFATGIAGLMKIPAPPITFTTQSNVDEDWARFSADLALILSDLDEDEFLIISTKKTGLYVQFAAQGKFGMRAEAVSNNYVDDETLPHDARVVMHDLGWNSPTKLPARADPEGHTSDGSPNFFIDAASPVPYEAIASLAVVTLRFVFRVGHPGELKYRSFGDKADSIRLPTLRIARERP
ncbi:hypothetical protein PWP93_02350 [Paraburkholderia sp. A1RI-2L]|uniref:TY-Chap domain-containing protein n=1 Tax=Paraburkholderia sp. A1RI-2L TaxID=3028367 RepID=UPI003B7F0D42